MIDRLIGQLIFLHFWGLYFYNFVVSKWCIWVRWSAWRPPTRNDGFESVLVLCKFLKPAKSRNGVFIDVALEYLFKEEGIAQYLIFGCLFGHSDIVILE